MSYLPNLFNISSLPSGLHSYAGDASHLKLRILFTNNETLSRRPNIMRKQEEFESCRDERVNTASKSEEKNKRNNSDNSSNNSINNKNNSLGDEVFHSSYLIKKVRGKWIIEAEGNCLMEDIEDERFEMRLLREPLLSRNCICKRGIFSQESGLHKHEIPSSLSRNTLIRNEIVASSQRMNEEEVARNDLFGSLKINAKEDREEDVIKSGEESTSASGCLSEKVKLTIAAINTTMTQATATTATTNRSSIGTGLDRSKRAFHWKDTFTVTSGNQSNMTNDGINISNDGNDSKNFSSQKHYQNQNRYQQLCYQERTLASKLPIEMRNLYDYDSHKNLTSFPLSNLRKRSCRDLDNDIYHAQDSLLSCFPKVATILSGSLKLSDFYKEIANDQKTPLNHEAAREIRLSNKRGILLPSLYLHWLLLNERQQQRSKQHEQKEQISIVDLSIGQKRLALVERDDKFDNLLVRSSVDDIVDGLKSATALIEIESAPVINQLAIGEVANSNLTSGDRGGHLKATAHLKQPQVTGYLSSSTSGLVVGNNDIKLRHVSIKTPPEQIDKREIELEEQKGSEIRLNVNKNGEASSEARKKLMIIDESCAAIEKLLNSQALIDPTGSSHCCSHGEILFILMEKHMTTSLISGGESSISQTNFKRTHINDDDYHSIASAGASANKNDNNANSAERPTPGSPTSSSSSKDAILEGKTISQEEEEGEEEEGNENGNTDLKVQNHLGKLIVVKHHSSSINRSDRSAFPLDGESNINSNERQITLADNNEMMPDEIGSGIVSVANIDNSSSFAADKINPNFDSQKPSESSDKLINEQKRKINQTTTQSSSMVINGDDIQQDYENDIKIDSDNVEDGSYDYSKSNSNNDNDNQHELWMQQEQQRRRRSQLKRQKLSLNQTENHDDNSQVVVVCLGVIVIDTLNKFIQVKPDLNKLISVNICQGGSSSSTSNANDSRSTSLRHHNAVEANQSEREAANRCRRLNWGQLNEHRLSTVVQSGGLNILSEGSQLIPISPLVYQLELVETFRSLSGNAKSRDRKTNVELDGRADADRVLNFVREQLLAPNFLPIAPSKPLDQFRASSRLQQQQQVFLKSKKTPTTPTNNPSNAELSSKGFLTPVGGSVLIKLQFSIHSASDFPRDCHNLHVKYKLFSQTKSNKWKLRRKKALKRMKDDAVVNNSLVPGINRERENEKENIATANCVPDLASNSRQEIQKVTQMSQSRLLVAQQQLRSATFSTTSTCGAGSDNDEFEKPSAKSITFNGHHKQTAGNGDKINLNNDVHTNGEVSIANHGNSCSTLLLEGSTITSRSNSRGVFHFDCTEELVLECIEREKNKWSSNYVATSLSSSPKIKAKAKAKAKAPSDSFTSTSGSAQPPPASSSLLIQMNNLEKQHKSLDLTTKEANYDVLTRVLDDNVTTRKRDENNSTASTQIGMLTSSPSNDNKPHDDEKALARSLLEGDNSSIKLEQQEFIVGSTQRPKVDNITNQCDADENVPPANEQQNFVELSPTLLLGLSNAAEDNRRSRTNNKDISSDNVDGELSEEADGGRGSRIKADPSLSANSADNDDDEIQEMLIVLEFYSSDFYRDKLQGWSHLTIPINLNGEGNRHLSPSSTSEIAHQMTRYTCTNEQNQLLLPVIRPELSSFVDRLRYYLIGQFPGTIPEVDNFSRCHQRYMLLTKQSGKVLLDYEVVRQFSDPNFDRALSDIMKIGKQRQKYSRQTWCPYNSLNSSSYSHNHELADGANSSDEEYKQKQQHNLDTQQVIDAYQKARHRIDVLNLNLNSFSETTN